MIQNTFSKTELRQSLIAKRLSLSPEQRRQWDIAIGNRLTAWLATQNFAVLGVYWPIRAEPDLREFYADWAAHGMQLALPAVIDKNTPLKFLAWTPGDNLMRDAMGVMTPPPDAPEVPPDAMLAPCVGFTQQRYRLGYGAGFYVRSLAGTPRPKTIGIAYSCLRAEFATAPHDVALDLIATEDDFI